MNILIQVDYPVWAAVLFLVWLVAHLYLSLTFAVSLTHKKILPIIISLFNIFFNAVLFWGLFTLTGGGTITTTELPILQ